MNNKTIYPTKPKENLEGYQLFSIDKDIESGAKKYIFSTYTDMYNMIINSKNNHNYEDNTYAKSIKLFVDIDEKRDFTSELDRDLYGKKILNIVLLEINNKLLSEFNIDNNKYIILVSDTLKKLSYHIIFPEIVFNNIYEMKSFMTDIKTIDHSVYKTGCFRMLYNTKKGKDNKLILFETNCIYNSDIELFLLSCLCNSSTNNTLSYNIIESNKNKVISSTTLKTYERNYIYDNYDINRIKRALNKLESHKDEYISWITIGFCIKDLYLSCDDKESIYKLFDDFSKKSDKYDEYQNKIIFDNMEPKVDINYLFKLAEENYYILPKYDFQKIIFNIDIHKNIIIKNEKYIDIDINNFKKYKYLLIKSPTGTGKTTVLKELLNKLDNDFIISITSRKNLAYMHSNLLDLHCYTNINNDFKYCNRLAIQLESLIKCNYKLYTNGIVILDEINSLLSHLRSPTLNNRRKDVYLYLCYLIKNAKYVICMDQDLSQWNIDFLMAIHKTDYIIYYNTIQNKLNSKAIFYSCPQVVINIMANHIQEKKYFICCFDSLTKMNGVIDYLSKTCNKDDFLIYSSEVKYGIIETEKWINKFVFFTPSILYGIDFNFNKVNVFCMIYKNHLNPLQIYQMISRARNQKTVYIYCNEKPYSLPYKSIDDVITEVNNYEKNFSSLFPEFPKYLEVDDKPYRIMYYNYKYLDSLLRTNIKSYLIDIMKEKGYIIKTINLEVNNEITDKALSIKPIRERIVKLLKLDKKNLSEFETVLCTDDKKLEKHFNLRILLNSDINDELIQSISSNLFLETVTNKYTKIKIIKELLNVLEIKDINNLNKEVSKKFNSVVDNNWFVDNLKTIKKVFYIRSKKYDTNNYYNTYMLLITLLKNMFDTDLFKSHYCKINKNQYYYYDLDNGCIKAHLDVFKKLPSESLLSDY